MLHPQLNKAAGWNTGNSVVNFAVTLFSCCIFAEPLGRVDPGSANGEGFIVVMLHILCFILPASILLGCARRIRNGEKSAVTTSIVICSFNLLPFLLIAGGSILAMKVMSDYGDVGRDFNYAMLILLLAGGMITTLILNIIHLARCYRFIRDLNFTGQRGFEPVMAIPVEPIPEPPLPTDTNPPN